MSASIRGEALSHCCVRTDVLHTVSGAGTGLVCYQDRLPGTGGRPNLKLAQSTETRLHNIGLWDMRHSVTPHNRPTHQRVFTSPGACLWNSPPASISLSFWMRQHAAPCLVRGVMDGASLSGPEPPPHLCAPFICYTFIVHNPSALTSSRPVSFFIPLLYRWRSFFLTAVIDCLVSAVCNWPR